MPSHKKRSKPTILYYLGNKSISSHFEQKNMEYPQPAQSIHFYVCRFFFVVLSVWCLSISCCAFCSFENLQNQIFLFERHIVFKYVVWLGSGSGC